MQSGETWAAEGGADDVTSGRKKHAGPTNTSKQNVTKRQRQLASEQWPNELRYSVEAASRQLDRRPGSTSAYSVTTVYLHKIFRWRHSPTPMPWQPSGRNKDVKHSPTIAQKPNTLQVLISPIKTRRRGEREGAWN